MATRNFIEINLPRINLPKYCKLSYRNKNNNWKYN